MALINSYLRELKADKKAVAIPVQNAVLCRDIHILLDGNCEPGIEQLEATTKET